MPDGLYDRDALLWAEQQADLLRRLASGERVNDAVDWPNVIEEVHDVGRSELRTCGGLLQQAMVHLLKLHAWPGSRSADAWRHEAEVFLDGALDAYTPSMAQRIDLDLRYARALRRARSATDESGPPRLVPDGCPFTMATLLDGDVDRLLQGIGTSGVGE